MTLRRRMILSTTVLTASVVLMCAAAVWGLLGLLRSAHHLQDRYVEIRIIEQIIQPTHEAARLAQFEDQAGPELLDRVSEAVSRTGEFLAFQQGEARRHAVVLSTSAKEVHDNLREILLKLREGQPPTTQAAALAAAHERLQQTFEQMDNAVAVGQRQAYVQLRSTTIAIAGLSIFTVLAAVLLNVLQYRSAVLPLERLRDHARRLGAGDFATCAPPGGTAEFTALFKEFNEMAGRLEQLYDDLEARVRARSRELARSERLASVGFLAAGVAHEINNPLGIISAHAELGMRKKGLTPELHEALGIIRDQAFHCKEIITQLLSLSRKGESSWESVSLADTSREVVTLLSALKDHRKKSVAPLATNDQLVVRGNKTELKQIFLNLAINGLEAVVPGSGAVRFEGHCDDEWVELSVIDNGCGMDDATLERVFEPFYSADRPSRRQGLGLGLAISHAIAESHGGELTAASAGPGKGSCFTLRLPVANGSPGSP